MVEKELSGFLRLLPSLTTKMIRRPLSICRSSISRYSWNTRQGETRRGLLTTSRLLQRDRVLLLDDILLAQQDLEQLKGTADVVRSEAKSRDAFIEEIGSLQPKAIYRHFGGARSVQVTGKFDADLVSSLPASLKFISHNGAGYDQLDIKALTARKIQVTNVPTVVDDSTATTALWLLIGALRQFNLAQQHLAAGTFNSQFPFKIAQDPGPRNAKVLGIVGAGGIGQELAKKASAALNMEIVYHNRRRLSPEQEANMTSGNPHLGPAKYVASLDELLQHSDAVSVHCPFTPETRHLIGARQLGLMKPSAVLVNTARGPIVDEESLVMALEHGKIAGVGLDVFENEPTISQGLLKHERALLLPHVGTLAYGTQQDMERFCLQNIMHALQTGKLKTFVSEQKGLF